MAFDFDYMVSLFPLLLSYLGITMEMAFLGLLFSLALAVAIALIRVFRVPGLNGLAQIFISFFRGTPLLVQLFLLYYGLPQVIPSLVGMDAFTAAVIGISLHFSAYMAESIRAAILGVDRSQMEASLAIGMTTRQAMQRIILPQAVRIALPSLMNYFIDMIKATSLAFTLGVTEIMAQAQMEASSSFKFFEAYLAVALIYWAIVVALTRVQYWAEAHLNKAYQR
ncbi:ABC transporter permease [Salinivibrio sp. MA351]|jgi:putative amino-acid transport system permease protein|uniref:amino acid ABC transporter permease n=1 Tax=unclassified Salinivibrio TaxID=2636825 RepID=UPI00098564F7|nr:MULTISPECIES: amino acid ABC transporter permease [unclassified Salinivibrio]NUY57556.1 amino acid ABC transporter permease [Salinivibrio sp. EAGSL]OOE89972.1 ABC transporter permease [Salinivibrio sp. AR647]OOE91859.1 ABC transporter permease [Salinivibrio sp. AR640]OOE97574.1 ABC transporter permease [Salinivibrio sp. MA351]OOF01712.1 ABC transporter permease [Salinivibrio sp. MA440]